MAAILTGNKRRAATFGALIRNPGANQCALFMALFEAFEYSALEHVVESVRFECCL